MKESRSACFAFRSLALASLHFRELQVFWKLLNAPEFHLNVINVREANPVNIDESQDEVFIAYLKCCQQLSTEQSLSAAWRELELLFDYFRKIYHCIRPAVQATIEETVEMFANGSGGFVVSDITRNGKCNACQSTLDQVDFTKEEIAELCEEVKNRVLFKEDMYQSTMPHEIERFDAKLAASGGYDVIIDGLNVALSRFPGVHFKHLQHQSMSVYEAVKVLQSLGMKSLLIHRPVLYKYPHFKQISNACDYLILDKVSQDDPFVLIAALASGPKTFFMTNDTLRQHFVRLPDSEIAKLFTKWQLARQLTYFNQVKLVNKKIVGLTSNIYFPPRHTSSVCRTRQHWHLPLDHRFDIADGHQKSIIWPKKWLCIPAPKSPVSFQTDASNDKQKSV